MKKLKYLDLFSGIGAFPKAMENLNIDFDTIGFCEIDKFAIKSYCAIHDENPEKNLGDITKVNTSTLPDFDLVTFGSPCQDFSVAGKQEGAMWTCSDCGHKYNPLEAYYKERNKCPKCKSENLEKTRSSLIAEGLRLIEAKKPKYVIYENVKNLVNKQFKPTFDLFIKELEDYGYKVWYKVLNAKSFGVPQSRERIFVCGILNGEEDDFTFPEGFESNLRLKDVLENNVDEKYYIEDKRCERLLEDLREKIEPSQNNIIQITNPSFSQQRIYSPEGNAPTIAAGNSGGGKEPCKILVENDTNKMIKVLDIPKEIINDNERQRRVYSPEGISPTILARQDNAKILTVGMLDMKGSEQVRRVYDINGLSPTLDTMQGGHRQPKIIVHEIVQKVRVRKYEVNVEELKKILRTAKKDSKISNKKISETLKQPLTLVEHWFRTDSCFSIPDENIWFELKELLHITTDKFDKSITEFEIKDNIYEKGNRVYDVEGIAPTLTSTGADEKILEVIYDTKNSDKTIIDDTYGYDGIRKYDEYCPTLRSGRQGLKVLEENKIQCVGNVNPSKKGMNGNVFLSEGLSPTLTTNKGEGVKIMDYERTPLKFLNRNGKKTDGDYAFCIDTSNTGGIKELYTNGRYRIRKLTPLEALRLMGFSDKDYLRCREVAMSDSQLYKQAGNSIVVDVIMYIMKNMFDIK